MNPDVAKKVWEKRWLANSLLLYGCFISILVKPPSYTTMVISFIYGQVGFWLTYILFIWVPYRKHIRERSQHKSNN
jgi:F0F1-type ATP synthase assembly protein I